MHKYFKTNKDYFKWYRTHKTMCSISKLYFTKNKNIAILYNLI